MVIIIYNGQYKNFFMEENLEKNSEVNNETPDKTIKPNSEEIKDPKSEKPIRRQKRNDVD